MRKHIVWCLMLVMLLLLAAPPVAMAARKTIKPLQFTHSYDTGTSEYWQTPVSIGSDISGGGHVFTAPLKLPVGATITGFSYWHSKSGTGGSTEASLLYSDETTQRQGEVKVFGAISIQDTGAFTPIEVIGEQRAGEDNVVRKDRKYMVRVSTSNGGFVWEVKVNYRK